MDKVKELVKTFKSGLCCNIHPYAKCDTCGFITCRDCCVIEHIYPHPLSEIRSVEHYADMIHKDRKCVSSIQFTWT
jgi:hypothetical protein